MVSGKVEEVPVASEELVVSKEPVMMMIILDVVSLHFYPFFLWALRVGLKCDTTDFWLWVSVHKGLSNLAVQSRDNLYEQHEKTCTPVTRCRRCFLGSHYFWINLCWWQFLMSVIMMILLWSFYFIAIFCGVWPTCFLFYFSSFPYHKHIVLVSFLLRQLAENCTISYCGISKCNEGNTS